MSFPQFFISLDNPTKSYFAGQTVTGTLVVDCSSPSSIKGIEIKFTGTAYVHWTEQHSRTIREGNHTRTETHTEVHTDTDKFVNYKYFVLGDDRSDLIIQPGRHQFPLNFNLPLGIPSSFVGDYGKVFYEVKAEIKRSMFKLNHRAKQHFTVNAFVDLNADIAASQPQQLVQSKNLCCLCCTSGPIGFILKLPRVGYVPGEVVFIEAELQNNSGRNVNGANISLIQVQSFHAHHKTKTVRKTLMKAGHGPVGPGDSEVWRDNVLQIPPVPPTRLGNCRLIDVQYLLQLEMDISGPAINLRGGVDLTIGTIPLRVHFQALRPPNWSPEPAPSAPSAPSFLQDYPDLPPPSYKEAMLMPREPDQNPIEVNSSTVAEPPEYLPNYVTYGWTQTQQQPPSNTKY